MVQEGDALKHGEGFKHLGEVTSRSTEATSRYRTGGDGTGFKLQVTKSKSGLFEDIHLFLWRQNRKLDRLNPTKTGI